MRMRGRFGTLKLDRVDRREVVDVGDEVRLFSVIRDERLRLPRFLAHYRRLGVGRFFFVDNDSSDGSREWLLDQPDCHVYIARGSYRLANCGHAWLEMLLARFGWHRWCVVVDADEFLVFPRSEELGLPVLARYLDEHGATFVRSTLLDMHSSGTLSEARYEEGTDPLSVCDRFDAYGYYCLTRSLHRPLLFGGMRPRVFGVNACLSKIPFLKPSKKVRLGQGAHTVRGGVASDVEAAVLHFKFFSDFTPRVYEEVRRREHWRAAKEYRCYAAGLDADADRLLSDVGSVKYADSRQLVNLGIMATSERFEKIVGARDSSFSAPPASIREMETV